MPTARATPATTVAEPGARVIAAIYVRVSGESQEDNYSLPSQEAACRAFAARLGYVVSEAHVYREVHTASELHERPLLTKLREAMARGEIGALVCFDPDRFSRKQVHTAILQDICERAGVILKFAEFDFENSATGRFMLGARAFAAELELEKIKERTTRGVRTKVASGKLHGRAHAPWGYRYDETRTRLVPDEATAPYVRMLFARVAAGETVHAAQRWLNESGIPTPKWGARWHRQSVIVILRQRAYLGEAVALTTRTTRERGKIRKTKVPDAEGVPMPEGTVAQLVDRATWETVQKRLRRNQEEAARRNRDPEQYLLRAGFIVCGICGKNLRTHWRKANGTRYPMYAADEERHRDCAAPVRDFKAHARRLDAEVWEDVLAHVFSPDRLFEEAQATRPVDPAADALVSVERLLAEADRSIRNVTAGIAALDDDDARTPLLAEVARLTTRRRALLAERESLLASREVWHADEARRRALRALWRSKAKDAHKLTYQGKRDMLADLGVRVRLYPGGRYRVVTPDNPEGIAGRDDGAIVATPSGSSGHNVRWITIAERSVGDRPDWRPGKRGSRSSRAPADPALPPREPDSRE